MVEENVDFKALGERGRMETDRSRHETNVVFYKLKGARFDSLTEAAKCLEELEIARERIEVLGTAEERKGHTIEPGIYLDHNYFRPILSPDSRDLEDGRLKFYPESRGIISLAAVGIRGSLSKGKDEKIYFQSRERSAGRWSGSSFEVPNEVVET